MNREIAPPSMAPPAAHYAHGTLVENPMRWVYTAGVVPSAPDGTVPTGADGTTPAVYTQRIGFSTSVPCA